MSTANTSAAARTGAPGTRRAPAASSALAAAAFLATAVAPLALGLALGLVLGLALTATVPQALHAQSASGPGSDPGADWLAAWSPLRPVVDLPRLMPGTTLPMPGLLTAPAPRAGLFWTAGNPAALVAEQGDGWNAFQLEALSADGDYRRPLDPGTEEGTRLSAQGWGAAGGRSAAAGRLVLDRLESASPAHAAVAFPFGSSPLVILDTAASAMGHTAARIEGAGGVAIGPAALGVALGFHAQESRTLAAPVPRQIRVAAPAATLGATLAIPGTDHVHVGVHARWQRARQGIGLYSIAAATRIYQVSGYDEVRAMDLVAVFYNRDIQRESRGGGASLAATIAGARFVVYGEAGSTEEAHTSVQAVDPPSDTWTADGLSWGIAATRAFLGDRLDLHGTIRRASLDGITRLHEWEDLVIFTAEESRLDLALDGRLDLDPWTLGLRVAGTHESRLRTDSMAGMPAQLESWTTAGAAEVARAIARGLSAAVGFSVATYKPAGTIPAPEEPGNLFFGYVGPELVFYGTEALAYAAAGTLRWDAPGKRAAFHLQARVGSASPSGSIRLQMGPDTNATRAGWSLGLGATLSGGPP
jgi:hypothetical protein